MRSFAMLAAVLLGVALMLLPVSEAQSGNWLQAIEDGQGKPVLEVKSEKQKEKNKACGPGKVFVEGEGCLRREKAEKKKEKAKEKTQTTPTPQQPVKSDCRDLGPNEGAAGGAADPKMKYECEPLGGGHKRCCWVKYP